MDLGSLVYISSFILLAVVHPYHEWLRRANPSVEEEIARAVKLRTLKDENLKSPTSLGPAPSPSDLPVVSDSRDGQSLERGLSPRRTAAPACGDDDVTMLGVGAGPNSESSIWAAVNKSGTQGLAAPLGPSGEEGGYEIGCICGFSDDDGSTVDCEKCGTWQHTGCVYH